MSSSFWSSFKIQIHTAAGLVLLVISATTFAQGPLPQLRLATTKSSLDGASQAVTYWAPDNATKTPTPLFVFLHSWSSGYEQDNSKWQKEAVDRGWILSLIHI